MQQNHQDHQEDQRVQNEHSKLIFEKNRKRNDSRRHQLKSFLVDYWSIAKKALPMAISYTFSIEQATAGVIALRLNDDNEHSAAIVLFQSLMAFAIRLPLAPLFSVSLHASGLFGELTKAKRVLEESDLENQKDGVNIAGLTARQTYKNKQQEIVATLRAGLILSAFVSVPSSLLLFFSKEVLIGLGQQREVAKLAAGFLKPYTLSAPALAVRMTLGQIMYSNGDPLPAMYIGIGTLIIGTLLAIALAFGWGGMSALGFAGIAWGYNVESLLTVLAYAGYMLCSKKYTSFPLYDFSLMGVKSKLSELLYIGVPVTLTMLAETSLTFLMGIYAGLLGVPEQASLSYTMQLVFLSFIPLMAFGQYTGLFVGSKMGEKKYVEANRIAKNGLYATLVTVVPFCIFLSIWPESLFSAFMVTGKKEQSLVSRLVPIVTLGAVVMAARYNVNQVLRKLHDHKGSTIITIIGMLLVGALFAGIFGVLTPAGLYAISAGLAIGEGSSLLGLLMRWRKKIQPDEIKKVHEDPESAEERSWGKYFLSFFCSSDNNEEGSYEQLLADPESEATQSLNLQ